LSAASAETSSRRTPTGAEPARAGRAEKFHRGKSPQRDHCALASSGAPSYLERRRKFACTVGNFSPVSREEIMKFSRRILFFVVAFAAAFGLGAAWAQESSNSVGYVAKDRGLYKKYGLDADLLFIPSTTTSVSSLVAGDVQVANA